MKPARLKKNIFKILCCCLLLLPMLPVTAQENSRSKILPDHIKVQYAGNIGYLSVGAGYTSKKEKLTEDLYYGYVPKSKGGLATHSLTAKLTWSPFMILKGHSVHVKPFSIGVLVNYAFGKQYFSFSPDKYPFDYYKFPTSFHIGIFEGGEAFIPLNRVKGFREIGLYYELVTIDRELISYVNNDRALDLDDVFHLGLGIRAAF